MTLIQTARSNGINLYMGKQTFCQGSSFSHSILKINFRNQTKTARFQMQIIQSAGAVEYTVLTFKLCASFKPSINAKLNCLK